MDVVIIVLVLVAVFVFVMLLRTIQVIPQAQAAIVERFGRYTRTLNAGLNIVVPFIDTIRNRLDLREQVQPFPPQPVITQDNLVVNIDTVIYFQVTDPRAATYEVQSYLQAIEQLTITTLRNIIGSMDLESTLTSRETINAGLRGVLDEATGKWGIRVNRVELKAIEPPTSIQDSMEKQMRADRDKRAAILQAEGERQSAILKAEGQKQADVLKAEGEAQAAVLRADGEAAAIRTVFEAIHSGDADQKVLAYKYLETLPQMAQGDANKLWIIPSEVSDAIKGVGGAFQSMAPKIPGAPTPADAGVKAANGSPGAERRTERPELDPE
ncbi:SPFH/Band 7/PHB domain protein [Streptacidiphilus pinicola]|uniref:SPFH/Band 7/PHB domain protein n=1 Tax=Streptacidiphilus pinicola TaxID=2219663 RepID=A0A2X0IE42_9ACTN|nr:SPFH domain-containing protein [Streptacidiphilus pinicola]RAG81893.1 SPFH/Band 7/PHB domain protein [Streptacidiphilus pinicola]